MTEANARAYYESLIRMVLREPGELFRDQRAIRGVTRIPFFASSSYFVQFSAYELKDLHH